MKQWFDCISGNKEIEMTVNTARTIEFCFLVSEATENQSSKNVTYKKK